MPPPEAAAAAPEQQAVPDPDPRAVPASDQLAVPGSNQRAVPVWAVDAIIQAGRGMDRHGWVPATAGNISVRLPDGRIAITSSGGHKGLLQPDQVMLVDAAGASLTPGLRPSAETLLQCQIYALFAAAGAVVHGHSVAATVLGLQGGSDIKLTGYELFKAFDGQTTHSVTLALPVVDNDQDIARLADQLAPILRAGTPLGYLIRGHGVYVWGPDMKAALARLEGLEFLLACELERRKLER
jgi:methylthioribulose-1-phosphate dehydratase